jgi:energy-converting hydrogenase Eha subunit B
MYLVYLKLTSKSQAHPWDQPGYKTPHGTLMSLSIYSLLGNYAGKPAKVILGQKMAIITQDGCSHIKMNPYIGQDS